MLDLRAPVIAARCTRLSAPLWETLTAWLFLDRVHAWTSVWVTAGVYLAIHWFFWVDSHWSTYDVDVLRAERTRAPLDCDAGDL